ncbi:MAG: tetratricopeptide repeat protein [Pirellulaceae bacterium]
MAGLTSAIAILMLLATGVSLTAAMTFQQMASHNSKLAEDLTTALGDAQKNLAQVKEKEQLAQTNLSLATAEQQRAEGNLGLAIKALDTVFLEFIGNRRALQSIVGEGQSQDLSRSERELLDTGLAFYHQLIDTNKDNDVALFASGTARIRAGMLRSALGNRDAAREHFRLAENSLQRLVVQSPNVGNYHRELGRAYVNAVLNSDWPKGEVQSLTKAENEMSRAIELGATDYTIFNERATVRRWLGREDDAFKDDLAAISRNNTNPAIHAQFAWELAFRGRFGGKEPVDIELAIKHAAIAVELEPKNSYFRAVLGRCLYIAGRKQDAFKEVDTAVSLDSKDSFALNQRSVMYKDSGELEKALADANAAVAIRPDEYSWRRRATVFMKMRRYDEALADFERCSEKQRAVSYWYWSERGELHLLRHEYDASIVHLSKAFELAPNYAHYLYKRRAEAYFMLERFPQALSDLRKAWTLNPPDLSTLTWISPSLVAKCGNQEFKTGLLKLADEAVAKDPGARRHRAVIAMHLGNWDKAREDVAGFMKAESPDYSSYYQLAMLSLADKNQEQYRTASRDMLARFAESKVAEELNFTVWTAALAPQTLDDYGPAIALAQRGVELNKDNPEAIRSLGAILYRGGKFDEAAQQLAPLAAAAEKSSPEAKTSSAYPLFFLAMAQHQLGKKDEARATLQKAAELAKTELSDDKNPPPWNRKLTLELLQKEAAGLLGN